MNLPCDGMEALLVRDVLGLVVRVVSTGVWPFVCGAVGVWPFVCGAVGWSFDSNGSKSGSNSGELSKQISHGGGRNTSSGIGSTPSGSGDHPRSAC